jgi:hypothetical protein
MMVGRRWARFRAQHMWTTQPRGGEHNHVEAPCREAARLVDLVVIPCEPTAPDLEAIGATIYVLQETITPGVIVPEPRASRIEH